ncbi:prephenate dehydratase domain-containing protein [Acetobacteraceae bacterium ESL0709]|nr:prephenate dehydratase domain-containing protein [Acetobacteraceae bacterium ESL0697]MDF7677990.1 prephenate dehydratase domain-containing protein [Acetobacteraceae bacterium ESL0709]
MSLLLPSVAFMGNRGAFGHIAARKLFPDRVLKPCSTFDECFSSVNNKECSCAVLPFENSSAGPINEVHQLLKERKYHIAGEYFLPVHHVLMALPGVRLSDIKQVWSHPQALMQCRNTLARLHIAPVPARDTATAAIELYRSGNRTTGAIGSELSASLYGLNILLRNVEDDAQNTTKFVIVSCTAEAAHSPFSGNIPHKEITNFQEKMLGHS